MRLLYFMVIVTILQGFVVGGSKIPSPSVVESTTLVSGDIEVSWNKVESGSDEVKIEGYKLRVWELKPIKTLHYFFKDGKLTSEERESDQPINVNKDPNGKLTELVLSANETTATFKDVKPQVEYEFRVLAYTKNEDGPTSAPFRIKILG